MKIFRERGRTSRRGTRSFSSITTAALQNARRVYPAFSSSLFHLSLLLSFRLLSQNPFLPVASSICLGPRFYFYTQRLLSSPHSLFFPLSPPLPLFTSQLLYPPSLSLSLPLSVSLTRRLPHHSVRSLPSIRYPLLDSSPSPSLCSWPFLFKRRDCSLHILRDQPRSVCSSLSIYPSMLYSSVRQLNHPLHFSRRKILPFAHSFSFFLSRCFVSWLTFKVIRYENLQCKISWIYLTISFI